MFSWNPYDGLIACWFPDHGLESKIKLKKTLYLR